MSLCPSFCLATKRCIKLWAILLLDLHTLSKEEFANQRNYFQPHVCNSESVTRTSSDDRQRSPRRFGELHWYGAYKPLGLFSNTVAVKIPIQLIFVDWISSHRSCYEGILGTPFGVFLSCSKQISPSTSKISWSSLPMPLLRR
jgi:hypothetical protein